MYKHILVPLDQSEVAEQALPHAAAVAKAMGATISLVGVVPVLDSNTMNEMGAGFDWEAEVEILGEYLQALCTRLRDEGLQCESRVRKGDVAGEILRHAEEEGCDLFVMSTHGRSGLGRWIYGSVADRVLAQTHIPMLLVRAEEARG